MLNGVVAGGEASYVDDLPVTLERSGYTEECYFTFCYAPVHDEAGKARASQAAELAPSLVPVRELVLRDKR